MRPIHDFNEVGRRCDTAAQIAGVCCPCSLCTWQKWQARCRIATHPRLFSWRAPVGVIVCCKVLLTNPSSLPPPTPAQLTYHNLQAIFQHLHLLKGGGTGTGGGGGGVSRALRPKLLRPLVASAVGLLRAAYCG